MSQKLALAIETSTRLGGAALGIWTAGSAELSSVQERLLPPEAAHASLLLPGIDELLRGAGASPRDLALICVGIGPGSYTGLRVGIATALALAQPGHIPMVGVPSLAAVAEQSGIEGDIAVGANAYGGESYLAAFRRHGGEMLETLPVHLVATERLPSTVPPGTTLLPESAPKPATVLCLGVRFFAQRGADAPECIRPLYLRPSRAEIQFQR